MPRLRLSPGLLIGALLLGIPGPRGLHYVGKVGTGFTRQILDDLLSGFRRPGRVRVEPDRRRAIELALDSARPGDGVLIAGKGRERFQIFADRAIPFDDEAVATQWLRKHCPAPRRFSA